MKAAKAAAGNAEFNVWCEKCCIRVAPNEEQTVVGGKTYHSHCASKLGTKPKANAKGLPA